MCLKTIKSQVYLTKIKFLAFHIISPSQSSPTMILILFSFSMASSYFRKKYYCVFFPNPFNFQPPLVRLFAFKRVVIIIKFGIKF